MKQRETDKGPSSIKKVKNTNQKVGMDDSKINDPTHTQEVTERLRDSLMHILHFSNDWQMWVISHPEHLPTHIGETPDERFEHFQREFVKYIHKNREKLTQKEKETAVNILIYFHQFRRSGPFDKIYISTLRQFVFGKKA